VEEAFLEFSEETILTESPEYFTDMLSVVLEVVGVDEDIIEVDDDRDVSEVGEDFVHETLEGRGRIAKTEGHNQEFKSAVAGPEGGFPFITRSDPDIEVAYPEVDFGVNTTFSSTVEEIGDEGERVAVFLGNFVEPTIVDAKAESAVFFPDEDDRSTTRCAGLADPTFVDVFINELSESSLFGDGEGIDTSERRSCSFFKIDAMVARPRRRKPLRLAFTKDVRVIVVFRRNAFVENGVRRNVVEINGVSFSEVREIGGLEDEGLNAFKLTGSSKSTSGDDGYVGLRRGSRRRSWRVLDRGSH
jgi:hypothetical protein